MRRAVIWTALAVLCATGQVAHGQTTRVPAGTATVSQAPVAGQADGSAEPAAGAPSDETSQSGADRDKIIRDGISRIAGVDDGSGISYALISVPGKLVRAGRGGELPRDESVSPPPTLTAQCTRTPSGKLKFELLANFGRVPRIAFYPPWKRTEAELFPPPVDKMQLTMEFLGYTRVKPVKRQWESLFESPEELRYATPGLDSTNMEDISFYLRFLKVLPTLRLTEKMRGTVEFETLQWQEAVRAEELCRASGL